MKRKLTPREWMLLGVLAVVAAVSGYMMLFRMPMIQQRDGMQQQIVLCQEQLEAARELAALLETKEVVLKMKSGEGGRAFGSVSSKEIAAAAKTQCGLELDKKKIQLPEAIKALGIYEVNVRLHTKVTGRLKVKVVEE